MHKPGMFAVPDAPFIAASPDYVQTAPVLALIELKCVSELPPSESIPDHYRYQVSKVALTKLHITFYVAAICIFCFCQHVADTAPH